MPPIAEDVVETLTTKSKIFSFQGAAKFGIGTILCVAAAIAVWGTFKEFALDNKEQLKERATSTSAELKESNAFIRDQLLKQNERQGRMIALATKQIEASNLLIQQNMELFKATQKCLEEVASLYRELVRLMEKVYARLSEPVVAPREALP